MEGPRWDRGGIQSGFNPTANNPVSNTPGIIVFDGLNGASKYANHWDLNNFGPRVGFAYRLANNWALRGGFGVFYDAEYGTVSTSRILTTGFGTNATFNSPAQRRNYSCIYAGARYARCRTDQPDTVLRSRTGWRKAYYVTGFRGLGSRYAVLAAVELRLTARTEAWNRGGGFVRRQRRAQDRREPARHQPDSVDGRARSQPRSRRRSARSPSSATSTMEADAFGNSSYNALNTKVEKRFAKGLMFMANYTWSKFLDNVTGGDDMNGTTTTDPERLSAASG